MKKEDKILSIKIGATFVGTVVGAGFASGQEILKFFTVYRINGYLGIFIATVLFIILGSIIMKISYKIKRTCYNDFLIYVCGKKMAVIMDILITVFLFGTFNVMLSATGALFFEQFGLPYYFGIIFTLIPTILFTIKGMKGILNVNTVVAPSMVTIVFVICSMCIYSHSKGDLIRNLYYENDNTYKWLMSALLYVAYNIVLSLPILVPMGKESKSRKVLVRGTLMGSIAMGVMIFLINTVILSHIEYDSIYQIPMLYIVEPFNDVIRYAFVLVLWLEIFTTILSNLFGLSNRIYYATKFNYKFIVFIICIISVFISQFEFKLLLSFLYPAFGFISLIFIVFLISKQIYINLKDIKLSSPDNQNKVYKT
jgi:uncharacterized membrane protein YkvI